MFQQFQIYNDNIDLNLYTHINYFLYEWYQKQKVKANNLFMLLIARGRTVLFIFQRAIHKVQQII